MRDRSYDWHRSPLEPGEAVTTGGMADVFRAPPSRLGIWLKPLTSVWLGSLVLLLVSGPTNAPAQQTLVTFDNLTVTTTGLNVPAGYQGLNWNNFGYWDGATNAGNPSGYPAATISPPNVAYNWSGNPGSITSAQPFNFVSAYMTAAWRDNLQVEVLGFVGTSLTYSNVYTLSATAPILINFNYLGVDEVYFNSYGGTPHLGYSSSAEHFAMDNVTIVTNLNPRISTEPVGQAAAIGGNANFTVTAVGTAPLSYQWQKNGSNLTDGDNIAGSSATTLTVSNVSAPDTGTYSVIVSNNIGSAASVGAVLTIYPTSSTSLITFDDLTVTTNGLNIPAGYQGLNWNNFGYWDGATNVGNPSGYPAATISPPNVAYNWSGNSGSITSAQPFNFVSAYMTAAWRDNLQVEVLGFVDASLTYSNLYTLSATAPTLINFNYLGVNEVYFNSYGGTPHPGDSSSAEHFAMDNVTIVTNLALAITTQPQDQYANIGSTAIFSVTAVSALPLVYQWQVDGADINGATNSTLTLSNVQPDEVGIYDVVVQSMAGANVVGSIASAGVELQCRQLHDQYRDVQ